MQYQLYALKGIPQVNNRKVAALHILISSLTLNMKVTKIGQNAFYAHFEGFWLPSHVKLKLTSICVNLIMSIDFL